MPFDQYRTVVAALDRLTTQVGRVADTMPTPVTTPVTDDDDGLPTTGDDGPTANRLASWVPKCESGRHAMHGGMDCDEIDQWQAKVGLWMNSGAAQFASFLAATDDDARHSGYTRAYDAARAFIRTRPHDYMPTTIVERNALIFGAVNAALDAAPEPHAAVVAAEAQRDRLAAILREVLGSYSRVSTPHNDKAIAYTLPPIAPEMFERWRDALTTPER